MDVEILHEHADASVVAAIRRAGGTLTGQVPGTLVQARLPGTSLAGLAAVPGVLQVRRPVRVSSPDSGRVAGEEVTKTQANV